MLYFFIFPKDQSLNQVYSTLSKVSKALIQFIKFKKSNEVLKPYLPFLYTMPLFVSKEMLISLLD